MDHFPLDGRDHAQSSPWRRLQLGPEAQGKAVVSFDVDVVAVARPSSLASLAQTGKARVIPTPDVLGHVARPPTATPLLSSA